MKVPAQRETPPPPLIPMPLPIRKLLFLLVAVACLTPFISPPLALLLGLIFANTVGHPYLQFNSKATKILLQVSVVGLGFGMNIHSAVKAGKEGIVFTIASIIGTLILGYFLGKLLKIESKISQLISSGTAICGGSAIAAIAPVINATGKQMSVALGTVFVLNSIALLIFPAIGHYLHLSEAQFGLWAAIAIHDTSSVVGAASKYGAHSLEVATTVKLARALWIIPLSLGAAFLSKGNTGKIKVPWFIGIFVLAMALNSYVPAIRPVSPYLVSIAKAGLTLTLFLIGAGLSFSMLKSVGIRPLLQGVILWIAISVTTLWTILNIT